MNFIEKMAKKPVRVSDQTHKSVTDLNRSKSTNILHFIVLCGTKPLLLGKMLGEFTLFGKRRRDHVIKLYLKIYLEQK